MLCRTCRRQLARGAPACTSCGAPRPGTAPPLELVLSDATRIPLVGEVLIGRGAGSTVQLLDPSVSRRHARIVAARGGTPPQIEDAGSSHGTLLDGAPVTGALPLRDGACIELGNQRLAVERRRDGSEAGRTIVVPAGASLLLPAAGPAELGAGAGSGGMHPRVRSGYALKRLEHAEGGKRYVLKDLEGGGFLRLSERDAELFRLLDGTRSLVDLVGEAEARHGAAGGVRLARLLAELGERGWLAGIEGARASGEMGRLARWFRPKHYEVSWVGRLVERLYPAGGWVFFTRPALALLGVLAVAGMAVFAYLIAERYGTPFVVASKIGWGGLVFLLGRFAVVAVHELAHGLTMSSYGRQVPRAGMKLMAIFPYAFVDTSDAWFEPRRRRIAVSAAGPVSDLVLGALFAIACLTLGEGLVRDIFFQLALGAYIGAFFNLNPFLERDGYHILVDVLQEPGLRRRAREQFSRRLSGRGTAAGDSPVLLRYAAFGVVWSLTVAGFVIALTLIYKPILVEFTSEPVVWGVLGLLWLVLFVPVFVVLGRPLLARRGREAA